MSAQAEKRCMMTNHMSDHMKSIGGRVAAAILIAATSLAAAHAEDVGSTRRIADPQQVTGTATQNDDTATVARTSASAVSRTATYLGSAPYICSPSGFGERSKCFLRTSVQTSRR
jgi:hypothetical protein